jgi:hypothetical protein
MINDCKANTQQDSDTVCISRGKYDQLIKDQKKLRALEAGGVDNWEWYGDCFESDDDEESEEDIYGPDTD